MISIQPPFRRTLVFFVVFLPVTGFSQSDHNEALVDTLSRQMAIQEQLAEVPANIKVQFEQNPLQLPEKKNEQMLDLFDKAYDSKLLLDYFKTALRQKITDQRATEIFQWLHKKNTRTIAKANQEFYTLQGKRKQIVTMYEMDQQPPSEERTNLIASLVDTTAAVQSSIISSVIILGSVIKALNGLSEQQNFSDAQIKTIINNFKSQMQSQASQQLQNQLMEMYYNINRDTLQHYLSFLQTETGQWLHKVISQSMQSAYKTAADRFLQSVNHLQ